MSSAAYSDLKAGWHLKSIEVMRHGVQIVPKQVQLIICDLCNQNCHFCAFRMDGGFSTENFAGEDGRKNPNRRIPTQKCIEILDDLKKLGVKAVQFTGGGEPTVHPDFKKIVLHALDLGLECALVTNGVKLEGCSEILRRFSWVRVSVDAGCAETYVKVRDCHPLMWEKALSGIRTLCSMDSKCLVGVGYVITNENWTEVPAACSMFRRMGVPYVRLSAMFSEEGAAYYDAKHEEILGVIERAKSLQTDSFKVVDLFGSRIEDLEQKAPDYEFCGYQQFNMFIGGNQKIYRCCTTSYTNHGEVGDLSDQTLWDWFHSSAKDDAYRRFDARTCHTCQFNTKNRSINYLLSKEPTHVNFV